MANEKGSIQTTPDVDHGLAHLGHYLDDDGIGYSEALWDSWPVVNTLEALKEPHPDTQSLLAVLAARMFLAGSQSFPPDAGASAVSVSDEVTSRDFLSEVVPLGA